MDHYYGIRGLLDFLDGNSKYAPEKTNVADPLTRNWYLIDHGGAIIARENGGGRLISYRCGGESIGERGPACELYSNSRAQK